MADVTGTGTFKYGLDVRDQPDGLVVSRNRTLLIELADTADDGDTVEVDLANYGGSTLLGVQGFRHSTSDSVVVAENPTTAVSGTTVTLTVGGSTDNDQREYVLYYE